MAGLNFSHLLLLGTAVIWGLTFTAQIQGMDFVGPFSFMALRFSIAVLAMMPLLYFMPAKKPADRHLPIGGLAAGAFLFAGSALQQVALQYTTAANAGFITSLYIVIIPLCLMLAGQRGSAGLYLGVLLAAVGLYFLSITRDFTLAPGDGLVLLGAVAWAGHVLCIGVYVHRTDTLRLAILQYLVVATLSWGLALTLETLTLEKALNAAVSVAYAGIMATAVAFTLQVVGQKHVAPVQASLIMSTEAVFAALGGWWLLDQSLSGRAIFGCSLMMAGIVLAQLAPVRQLPPAKPA